MNIAHTFITVFLLIASPALHTCICHGGVITIGGPNGIPNTHKFCLTNDVEGIVIEETSDLWVDLNTYTVGQLGIVIKEGCSFIGISNGAVYSGVTPPKRAGIDIQGTPTNPNVFIKLENLIVLGKPSLDPASQNGGFEHGIHASFCYDAQIVNCITNYNTNGIYLENCDGIHIEKSQSKSSTAKGLWFQNCTNCFLIEHRIFETVGTNDVYGILIEGGSGNSILGCLINDVEYIPSNLTASVSKKKPKEVMGIAIKAGASSCLCQNNSILNVKDTSRLQTKGIYKSKAKGLRQSSDQIVAPATVNGLTLVGDLQLLYDQSSVQRTVLDSAGPINNFLINLEADASGNLYLVSYKPESPTPVDILQPTKVIPTIYRSGQLMVAAPIITPYNPSVGQIGIMLITLSQSPKDPRMVSYVTINIADGKLVEQLYPSQFFAKLVKDSTSFPLPGFSFVNAALVVYNQDGTAYYIAAGIDQSVKEARIASFSYDFATGIIGAEIDFRVGFCAEYTAIDMKIDAESAALLAGGKTTNAGTIVTWQFITSTGTFKNSVPDQQMDLICTVNSLSLDPLSGVFAITGNEPASSTVKKVTTTETKGTVNVYKLSKQDTNYTFKLTDFKTDQGKDTKKATWLYNETENPTTYLAWIMDFSNSNPSAVNWTIDPNSGTFMQLNKTLDPDWQLNTISKGSIDNNAALILGGKNLDQGKLAGYNLTEPTLCNVRNNEVNATNGTGFFGNVISNFAAQNLAYANQESDYASNWHTVVGNGFPTLDNRNSSGAKQ